MTARLFTLVNEADKASVIRKIQESPLKDKGGRLLQITVRRKYRKRSLSQNALAWAWNTIIAKETGHTPEEIHEFMKRRLLSPIVIELAGESVEVSASTAKMETVVMADYLNRYQAFAATDLDIVLPTPQDVDAWDNYESAE